MTLSQYTEQKYGTKVDLSFIERFNPELPKGVEVPEVEMPYRRARDIQAQLLSTGNEVSEDGKKLIASLKPEVKR